MKQLIITLLLLVATFSSAYSSNPIQLQTNTVYVDYGDGNGYSHVAKSVITITTDFDNDLITIGNIERFDVQFVDNFTFDKYKLLRCNCYDSNGIECIVEYFIYPNAIYFKVSYDYFVYKYKILQ